MSPLSLLSSPAPSLVAPVYSTTTLSLPSSSFLSLGLHLSPLTCSPLPLIFPSRVCFSPGFRTAPRLCNAHSNHLLALPLSFVELVGLANKRATEQEPFDRSTRELLSSSSLAPPYRPRSHPASASHTTQNQNNKVSARWRKRQTARSFVPVSRFGISQFLFLPSHPLPPTPTPSPTNPCVVNQSQPLSDVPQPPNPLASLARPRL